MRLFVFGPGYSSRAVVRHLGDVPQSVAATARSAEKAREIEERGYRAVPLFSDNAKDHVKAAVEEATHILISAAPNEEGDPFLNSYGELLANAARLKWVGYLSTVGVYGNHNGAWIDETAPLKPKSRRSIWRVAAEESWRAAAAENGFPLGIFRLSGIYGPGRNGLIKIENGTARRIIKPDQVFNRIHVEDIGRAVSTAARTLKAGVYNVTDDEPAPPQDVITFGAKLMGAEAPPEIPFADADMTPMGRSFYGENKRVRNDRMKADLGGPLLFPNYRAALEAMWPDTFRLTPGW